MIMARAKREKVGKEQLLLEASRLGQLNELEAILGHSQQKRKSNPWASLRKIFGPNSVRDPATGFTCLHHAALNGHSQCVMLLLAHGASMNAMDFKGSSPLHLAAWAGNLEVVRILLDYSSSISKQAQQQQPQDPLDIDLCNNDNQTPVSLAAQFGHSQVVSELLKHGANVHIRNAQLESALDLACLNGRLETVNLLLESSLELQSTLKQPQSVTQVALQRQPRPGELQRTQSMFTGAIEGSPKSGNSRLGTGLVSLLRRGSNSSADEFIGPGSPMKAQKSGKVSQKTSPTVSISSLKRKVPHSGLSSIDATSMSSIRTDPFGNGVIDKRFNQENIDPNNEMTHIETTTRLLPHSPLHYATRKGHSSLVNMLLYDYRANILQVTSQGSVLHEVALNNGPYSNLMIGTFFQYLATNYKSSSIDGKTGFNLDDVLNAFLSLKNAQQQTVFQVLNQMNNRSAHEIRRMIYMFSEQIQKLCTKQNCIEQQTESECLESKYVAPSSLESIATNVQSKSSQQSSAMQHKLFSDIKQINSFVTMKRAPRGHSQMNSIQSNSNSCNFNNPIQPNMGQSNIFSHSNIIQNNIGRSTDRLMSFQPNGNNLKQQSHLYTTSPSKLTRSVSNLMDISINHNQPLTSEWIDAMRSLQMQQTSNVQEINEKARRQQVNKKIISRSRDLGTILLESQRLDQPAQRGCFQDPTQGPDNQINFGSQCSPMNHLVRSQTDCTQLMSRFFGEQPISSVQLDANGCRRAEDHRLLNRHYHVFDHQFYPPRLVSTPTSREQGSSQKVQQTIAIIPPLDRDSSQRASERIACSSRPPNLGQMRSQLNRNCQTSRLSLNLDLVQNSFEDKQTMLNYENNRMQNLTMGRINQPNGDLSNSNRNTASMRQPRSQDVTNSSFKMENRSNSMRNPMKKEFDATSREIMDNFDRLICEELLNRDHGSIINCNLNKESRIDINQSKPVQGPSILTGVMLDMDRGGDRLTVSGTRISLADITGNEPILTNQNNTSYGRSNEPEQLDTRAKSSSCEPTFDRFDSRDPSVMSQNQTGKKVAPPKPPRPSINSKLGKQQSMIYDRPQPQSAQPERMMDQMRNQNSAQVNFSHDQRAQGISLTEPPKVKPPPVPPQPARRTAQNISRQLHVNVLQNETTRSLGSGSSQSASSDQQVDALKMASMSSNSSSNSSSSQSNASLTRVHDQKISVDHDSGLCNSSNSLSHDSDKSGSSINKIQMPVRLAKSYIPSDKRDPSQEDRSCSPPSPKTAQMHIQQALQPLANRSTAVTNTDPEFDHSTGGVLGWLLTDHDLVEESNDCDPDYDNLTVECQLDESPNVDTVNRISEDEDYAESTDSEISHHSSESYDLVDEPDQSQASESEQKREILLRVLIDSGQPSKHHSQDTFYLDPTELKRHVMSTRQLDTGYCIDAETTTEDELSAAIDEHSGYIRFTLRKRRKETDQNTHQTARNTNGHKSNMIQNIDRSINAKKSRLTSSFEDENVQKSDVNNGSLRRFSEQTNISPRILDDTIGNDSLAVTELSQWFSINLPGLIEYYQRFVSNGFDCTRMMNHPKLMNDEILKMIGIDNESHRELIKETVRRELPVVDLRVPANNPTVQQIASHLKLDHIMNSLDLTSSGPLNDRKTFCLFKQSIEHLPIGYKIRFQSALEENNLESSESTIFNDESETLTSQTFSSSSSRESIKSIILMQTKVTATKQEEAITRSDSVSSDHSETPVNEMRETNEQMTVDLKSPTQNELDVGAKLQKIYTKPESDASLEERTEEQSENLVSNFARRLEDEIGKKENFQGSKPVAAMRRINICKDEPKQNMPIIANLRSVQKRSDLDTQDLKEGPPESTVETVKPVRKLDAIRMTFERQIEETAKQRNFSNVKGGPISRPKPPPPIKPLKLMQANTFTCSK